MKQKNIHRVVMILVGLLTAKIGFCQVDNPDPKSTQVVPYPHVREADVMWSKRVWRRIDLREKINFPMYYPINPIENYKNLFDIIKDGLINNGSLTAYDPGILGDDDEFTRPLTMREVSNILNSKDSIQVDGLEGETKTVRIERIIKSEQVKLYELKEEWYFDRKYSTMNVRIIGICPYIEIIDETTGEVRGIKPLFWIYFPNLRIELIRNEVYNRHNDVRLTYDALFAKRMFGSYIIKESNAQDRYTNEYKTGIDALMETEDIKIKLINLEQDIWEY